MVDIVHRVGIEAPIEKVYSAVATTEGVAGWWTRETTGESTPGGMIDVRFLTPAGDEVGEMTMDVTALEPDTRVRWRVVAGPEEWIGTDVTFDLTREGDYTILLFGHRNWREAVEFTAHRSQGQGRGIE